MTVEKVNPRHPDPALIRRAAQLLKQGELVVLPTETVYGLAANALDPRAVRRIFELKGRPAHNPIIVHVADENAARELALRWPAEAARLAERYWPGPLTLVVPKRPSVPDLVTAGLDTVALRVPAHPVTRAVLAEAGIPIAAPSANLSGQLSPSDARHLAPQISTGVALVIDAGPADFGIESTVIGFEEARPVLLRPGNLDPREIESLVGPLGTPRTRDAAEARPSPGMLDRHYAPRARLVIVPDVSAARALARSLTGKVGSLLWSSEPGPGTVVRLPPEPRGYARELYAGLHRLDAEGCETILVEAVPDTTAWAGIRDRLRRASTLV